MLSTRITNASKQMSMLHWLAIFVAKASIHHDMTIQMGVASSRPDLLPTLSAAISFVHFLLVKTPFWWRMPAMLLRLYASVCRRYRSWPHWQWNRYWLCRSKTRNTSLWRLMRRANFDNNNATTTLLRLKNDGEANTSRKFSILSVRTKLHLHVNIAERSFEYKEVQQHLVALNRWRREASVNLREDYVPCQ